jgi:Ca2+-binding EF-hand superfamily protein
MSRLALFFTALGLLNPFFTNDSSAQGRRPSLQSPSESNPVPTAPMGRGGQGRASMGPSGASSGPSAMRGGHGHGGQASPLFTALDQNKDGLLSEAELRSAATVMKALDKDGDGKLSQAECQPAGGGHGHGGSKADPQAEAAATVEKLMTFDKNDDQSLTKDELPERMQDLIERADSNGDGKVTTAELKALALKEPAPTNPAVGAPGRGRFRQPSSPQRPPVDGDVKE